MAALISHGVTAAAEHVTGAFIPGAGLLTKMLRGEPVTQEEIVFNRQLAMAGNQDSDNDGIPNGNETIFSSPPQQSVDNTAGQQETAQDDSTDDCGDCCGIFDTCTIC